MNPNLYINISSVPNWNANAGQALVNTINRLPGVKMADVTLGDIAFPADNCHGVYLFQEGDNYKMIESEPGTPVSDYWYVGKCDGRAFVDRIGGHLAPRYDDYMNNLLKNIACVVSGIKNFKEFFDDKKITPAQRQKWIDRAFPVIKNLRLKIVCFGNASAPNVKQDIKKAEKILIKFLRPYLNNPNRKPRILSINPQP